MGSERVDIMKFSVDGEIKLKDWRKFSKKVDAPTVNAAKQKVYSLFGSNNRLKRSLIKISSVNKV